MTYLELLFPCLGKKKTKTKTNTPTPKSYFQDGACVLLLVKKKKKASLVKAQNNG